MRCTACCVLTILVILLLLSIGSLLSGIFGEAWWIEKTHIRGGSLYQGILRKCIFYITLATQCEFRQGHFMFESNLLDKNGDHYDIVLLCLTIAALAEILAASCSLSCTCCSINFSWCSTKRCWNCGTLIGALFASIGAIASIGGMVYCETKLFRNNEYRNEAWAYILAWIGTALASLAMLVSFLLIYVKPQRGYDATDTHTNTSNRKGYGGGMKTNNAAYHGQRQFVI